MNRLLCAASILALIVPSMAAAQERGDKNHGGQHVAKPQNGGGQHAAKPGGGRPPGQNRPGRPGGEHQQAHPPVTTMPIQPNRPGRPGAGERPTIQPVPNRPARPGVRPPNFRPIHAPGFRYPRGYSYRRWSIGLVLPSIFLTNYYFYNNWAALGAYPPPPGFVWVRYGPDLLLVSRRSGRIRDVIYGAFY